MVKKTSSIQKQTGQTAKKAIRLIAELALEKKAEHLVVLDVRKAANFCDYFIICSGNSDRQVKAIAEHIRSGLHEIGLTVPRPQGLREGKWAIVDAGDIVVHVFDKDSRDFYGLEYLWQAGRKINWQK